MDITIYVPHEEFSTPNVLKIMIEEIGERAAVTWPSVRYDGYVKHLLHHRFFPCNCSGNKPRSRSRFVSSSSGEYLKSL